MLSSFVFYLSMTLEHWIIIIHPIVAVVIVFPLIGITANMAWQTRQRRIQSANKVKSKIAPTVGREHVQIGRWLAGSVVGLSSIGLAHPLIFKNFVNKQLWQTNTFQAVFILLMYAATIASLVFLLRAKPRLWRAVFATLTGMGIVVLGFQDGVFRRDNEWYISHFYYGIAAVLLMVFSAAIVQEIYKDKSNTWRNAHIILNCLALLLFIGQGLTGARDLFEIGLYTPPPGFIFPWLGL